MQNRSIPAARVVLCLAFMLCASTGRAQDTGATTGRPPDDRTDCPALLARAFVDFSVGGITYPFSARQLEPGYVVESVHVPNLAARLSIGHRLNDDLSFQLTYLRPARWVKYRNVNGDGASHSVWTNVLGASLRQYVRAGPSLRVFGEGGVGMVTRHGVEIEEAPVVQDLVYAAPLLAAGIEHRLNDNWALQLATTFLPGRSATRQPYTASTSGGITYNVVARPPVPPIHDKLDDRATFYRHLIQVGFSTSGLGDGLNRMVSPIFWDGDAAVKKGVSIDYHQNVFHTKKVFSLDWGAALAYGQSRGRGDEVVTLSLFPLMRLTVLRTPVADLYFNYSVAGPTYISALVIDDLDTGKHFTFRDAIGIGAHVGKGKHLNVEARVAHYSNGNLLPRNSGVQVPLTLTLGYAF